MVGNRAGEPFPDHHVHIILQRDTDHVTTEVTNLCASLTVLLASSLNVISKGYMGMVYWDYSFAV